MPTATLDDIQEEQPKAVSGTATLDDIVDEGPPSAEELLSKQTGQKISLSKPSQFPKITPQEVPVAQLSDIVGEAPKTTPEEDQQFHARQRALNQAFIEQMSEHPGEALGNIAMPGVGTAGRGVTELATPGKRAAGAAHLVGGLTEAATPLLGPAALAPTTLPEEVALPYALKMAAGQAAGFGASEAAGRTAKRMGASPEIEQTVRDVGFFLPSLAGAALGVKGSLRTGEAGTAGTVEALGGRVAGGFAKTPGSYDVAAKFGETTVGASIPRAAPPPGPVEAATDAMARAQLADGIASGEIQPPAPPPPPGPDNLSPEVVQALADAIKEAPAAQQPKLILEAHENIAKWIAGKGRVVGPDGQILTAKTPEEAQKIATQLVNDAVKEQTEPPAQSAKKEEVPSAEPSRATGSTAKATPVTPTNAPAGTPTAAAAAPARTPEGAPVPAANVADIEASPEGEFGKIAKPETLAQPGPEILGTKEPESGRPIVQPTDNVEKLQQVAKLDAPKLDDQLDEIVKSVPGATFERVRPEKNPDRLDEKIEKEGQPAATVGDFLASQVVVNTPEGKDNVIQALKERFPIVKLDDMFDQGDEKYGYHHVSLQVQLPHGESAEVQIVPKEVFDVNTEEHHFYKRGREAELRGDTSEFEKNAAEAKKLHDEAWQKWLERTGQKPVATEVPRGTSHIDQIEPTKFTKGDRVTWAGADGKQRSGKVSYSDPNMGIVRVTPEKGGTLEINPRRLKRIEGDNVETKPQVNSGESGEVPKPVPQSAQTGAGKKTPWKPKVYRHFQINKEGSEFRVYRKDFPLGYADTFADAQKAVDFSTYQGKPIQEFLRQEPKGATNVGQPAAGEPAKASPAVPQESHAQAEAPQKKEVASQKSSSVPVSEQGTKAEATPEKSSGNVISEFHSRVPEREAHVKAILNRETEKGKPAFVVGDEVYILSGKYRLQQETISGKGRLHLVRDHDLSREGFERGLEQMANLTGNEPDKWASYNAKAKEYADKLIADREAREAERHAAEEKERKAREEEYQKRQANRAQIDKDFAEATFKQGKTVLPMADGQKIEAKGPSIGGLVVHKNSTPVKYGGGYDISHIESGLRISPKPFETQEMAKVVAMRLARLGDWTRSGKEVQKDKPLQEKAIQLLKDISKDGPYAVSEVDRKSAEPAPSLAKELAAGESGQFEPGKVVVPVAELYKQDVAPTLEKLGVGLKEVPALFVEAFYPRIEESSLVGKALGVAAPTEAVDTMMKLKGERERALTDLDLSLSSVQKMFERMPQADRVEFIDRIQTGQKQPSAELQNIADSFREIMDGQRAREEEAANLGRPKSKQIQLPKKENYFHNRWEKIPGGEREEDQDNRIARMFSARRPLEGSKGYNKQQFFTLKEGMAQGGVPRSTNPVTILRSRIEDGMKFVAARRMWNDLKELGLRKFIPAGQRIPEGYTDINDRIAKVYFPAESGEGNVASGRWVVEANSARLLNNFLSRDLIRSHPLGRGLMWVKNASTALELGLSPFHAVFETIEAASSQMALGMLKTYNQGLRQGNTQALLSGMKDILTSPAAPITMAREGAALPAYIEARARLANIGLTQFGHTISGEQPHGIVEGLDQFRELQKDKSLRRLLKRYPDLDQLVDDMFTGGMVIGQHQDYQVKAEESVREALANNNPLGAALRATPTLLQGAMKPLFQWYIPNLKYSLFLKQMSQQLAERSAELQSGELTRAELARRVVDSVENRFGELNFDNLFWDRTLKTAMQFAFRSVTWKLGNIREFGGAFANQLKDVAGAGGRGPGKTVGEKVLPRLDMKSSWLLSLMFTTAALGTIATKLLSGKYPWEWSKQPLDVYKETVHPRTGETDERGKPVRISLPTYWKDVEHLANAGPSQYVLSSLSSTLSKSIDIAENRDYFGNYVYNPNDPFLKRQEQKLKYAFPSPFVVSSYQRGKQMGEGKTAWLSAFGFPRAPSDLDFTKAEKMTRDLLKAREAPHTPEEMEEWRQKREAFERGKLSPRDARAYIKSHRQSWMQRSFERLKYSEAVEVYKAASPQEKKELHRLLTIKRRNQLKLHGRAASASQ